VSTTPLPITGRTQVLAILGDPVTRARAPGLVNATLAMRGIDAVMVALPVSRDHLASVIGALRVVHTFRGAVVTMPHKSAIVPLLDQMTVEARQIGACNVFRRESDGKLVGTMLDGEGFVAGLRSAGHDVPGKRVLLVGAGGAAAAIAFAMGKHGAAAVTIHNRTTAKAESLATRVRATWPTLEVVVGDPTPAAHDVIVNATSLGMQAGSALPLDLSTARPGTLAADIVISDEPTPFLAAAARRGCLTHPGLPMLAAQIELMVTFITSRD